MLIDMHTHLECFTREDVSDINKKRISGINELEERERRKILSFFSLGTPDEWKDMELLERMCYNNRLNHQMKSFGIHPWYSDKYDPEQYLEFFRACDAVGETGMDSVWCTISPETQKKCLLQQLQIAEDLKKPIFLHTKGQESEIYELVKDFSQKICVHWYSGDRKTFEKYLEAGCFFTIGPDIGYHYAAEMQKQENGRKILTERKDRASIQLYQYMVRNIPAERLFLETDGIPAVEWAYDMHSVSVADVEQIMRTNLHILADVKGYSAVQMEKRLELNLIEFIGKERKEKEHECSICME